MGNKRYGECSYEYHPEDGDVFTKIKIDKLGLQYGQILFRYDDYGDDGML
jgi:hypothetical protein